MLHLAIESVLSNEMIHDTFLKAYAYRYRYYTIHSHMLYICVEFGVDSPCAFAHMRTSCIYTDTPPALFATTLLSGL